MQRVFVLDKNRNPLMPCHPARARELLKKGRASVYRRYPFTIIIHDREGGDTQEIQVKIDPGSKMTGMALVANFKRGLYCIWACELTHRGQQIVNVLFDRRQLRRFRRSRNLRYRPARFDNRKRPKGWLPPSLTSRIDNITTWVKRLKILTPITHIALENVKFDTQKMGNPEISGVEYQRGTLHGYDVWEYLLEKFGRKCAYCGTTEAKFEKEHIIPLSRGGTNRVDNLTIACHSCNQKKGNMTAKEFGYPEAQKLAKQTMKDTSAVNSTRKALLEVLVNFNLPIELGTGAMTKFNRVKQNYPKTHWLDAVCIGESGIDVFVPSKIQSLLIKAVGHGNRKMSSVNKFGFPVSTRKNKKVYYGFQTGDIAHAIVLKGKKIGVYTGKVTVRAIGNFKITTVRGVTDGISHKCFTAIHKSDGYSYYVGTLNI